MQPGSFIVQCPKCKAKNRIPRSRLDQRAVCGKCGSALSTSLLYPEGIVDLTDQEFSREILSFSGRAVVELYSPRCGYCITFAPTFERAAREFVGKIKFARMNTELNGLTPSRYAVSGTPTLLFFRNGKLVNTIPGAPPADEFHRYLSQFAGN